MKKNWCDEFAYGKNKEKNAKYFNRYNTDNKIRPLFIKLPQMSECLKKYETNQRISFEMKDEILLEKYKSIWNRISNIIGKDFNGQPFCAGKYLNTKKSYNGKTFITKSNPPPKKKNFFVCLE